MERFANQNFSTQIQCRAAGSNLLFVIQVYYSEVIRTSVLNIYRFLIDF